jgi:hypothetical protein
MLKSVAVRIEGTRELLMHNGQLADPLSPSAKALKEVTSKKSKTDSDHEEVARIEFLGSLYQGDKKQIVVPQDNIEAMLEAAARKFKKGKDAVVGMTVDSDADLIYDGPKDPNKLWLDKRFVSRKGVVVQRSRVMRTRPRFKQWALEFVINFDDEIFNVEQVEQITRVAGSLIGLCDWRGKRGLFVVKKFVPMQD